MKVPFAARVSSLAILLAISSLAVGQEPAKKASVSKGEDRAALEKELWDADQQWLCKIGRAHV
jgi:hypothetical protein